MVAAARCCLSPSSRDCRISGNGTGKKMLERNGVTLREPLATDAAAVTKNVQDSHQELARWMPWATADYDETSALQWINGELGDAYRFLILHDENIVGSCGLNQLDELNKRANLGYWVRSDATGKGIATSATLLLAAHGFAAGLERLEIFMSTRNKASQRVAEKAGAKFEGTARRRLLLGGEFHDAHLYSLIASDFE